MHISRLINVTTTSTTATGKKMPCPLPRRIKALHLDPLPAGAGDDQADHAVAFLHGFDVGAGLMGGGDLDAAQGREGLPAGGGGRSQRGCAGGFFSREDRFS